MADAARAPRPKRRKTTAGSIEAANEKSNEEFVREYLRPSPDCWPQWTHPQTGCPHTLSLARAADLSGAELEACLGLVEATSGDDYRRAAAGWRPAAKRREMRSPGLRYVLVRGGGGRIAGFASLMPTYEAGEPVVYCYELHLEPGLRGAGLGARLMELVARAAAAMAGVAKVMLTCFERNARARRFYARLGFAVDDSSPAVRRLRGGRLVAPDYAILSRPAARGWPTA